MKLKALRAAVASAASSASAAWSLECLPYVPDQLDPPTLFIRPGRVAYDKTYARGMDEIPLEVVLLVSRSEDRDAQEFLDDFLDGGGPASIKAAIEAGRHTGTGGKYAADVCDDLHVQSVDAYQWMAFGGDQQWFLGARWSMRCIGSGT